MARTPDGAPGTTARVGRQLSTDVRRQARAGVGRDRPPRRARRRCDASVRAGHSIGSRERLRPERRVWPTSWLRGFTWRAASRRSPQRLSAERAQLLSRAGARSARCGNSTSATRSCARKRRRLRRRHDRHARRAAGCRDGGQGFAGGVRRDRPRQADRDADDGSRSSMPAPSVACSSCLRGDEPRIEAEATTGRGRVEVTLRQTAVTRRASRIRAPLRDPDAGKRDP